MSKHSDDTIDIASAWSKQNVENNNLRDAISVIEAQKSSIIIQESKSPAQRSSIIIEESKLPDRDLRSFNKEESKSEEKSKMVEFLIIAENKEKYEQFTSNIHEIIQIHYKDRGITCMIYRAFSFKQAEMFINQQF